MPIMIVLVFEARSSHKEKILIVELKEKRRCELVCLRAAVIVPG
jgi:hypothetical protein